MLKNKSMVYKRIFATYILMIIFLLISLDIFFIKKELLNIKNSSIYINGKVTYDVNKEINNINNNANVIIKNMYSDKYITNDVIDFLNRDTISYIKYKLDKFSMSKDYFYNGIDSFVKNSFSMNDSLENIAFVSYSRGEISSFDRDHKIEINEIDTRDVTEPYKLSSVVCKKNSISYIREIRDEITLEVKGEIICTYNLDILKSIVNKYEEYYEVMILTNEGNVVYDSNGEYEYEEYPYFIKVMDSNDKVQLDKKYYVTKALNTSTLITIAKVPEIDMGDLPKDFFSSLFFIDILLFIIVGAVLYIKLKRFSDRTDALLIAMDKVKSGDLNISIPITNENDEIDYISKNFNEMCENLSDHIEKSYLAEINQKNAEMVALQNQINPHFLYNTLESIRMKAICNGDKEVGKMLYTLAFLFRKQLKEKNVITIRSELEYCEKYLEIFKFRYDEKFEYSVDVDEKLLDNEIIKFTLQPLIENYFVHGISLENYENKLCIEIKRQDEDMIIYIKDNGNGISEVKLKNLNSMLDTSVNLGESIGLLNVHERIKIRYGKNYGVKLVENKYKGVTVVVKLPCRKVENDV